MIYHKNYVFLTLRRYENRKRERAYFEQKGFKHQLIKSVMLLNKAILSPSQNRSSHQRYHSEAMKWCMTVTHVLFNFFVSLGWVQLLGQCLSQGPEFYQETKEPTTLISDVFSNCIALLLSPRRFELSFFFFFFNIYFVWGANLYFKTTFLPSVK